MAQNITIKISGKEYQMVAQTPESERAMRMAADEINNLLVHFDGKYPDRSFEDKLAFVTINEGVCKVSSQAREKSFRAEVEKLHGELESYLSEIESHR